MSGSNIAQLGITVDSSGVTSASAALKGLTSAAAPAAAAVTSLTNAAKPAAAATAAMATASKSAAGAHGGLSTQAMAAGHSVRSAIESIIAGASPTQALALQLNHLSYAASGPQGISGAFSEMAGTLGKFISPAVLVGGALVGIGVAAAVAFEKIKSTELEFGALADRTNTTVQALHGLESVASFKGIDTADFIKAMQQFGDLSDQARNNMGQLAELFRTNGVQAGSLEQNISHVSDLLKNATSTQAQYNVLGEAGLPKTEQWVNYLKQGGPALQDAVNAASQFGGAADEQLIAKARKFDEEWNTSIKNFQTGFKSAFVSISEGFANLGQGYQDFLIKLGANPLGLLSNAFATGGGSKLTANSNVSDFYGKTGAGTATGPAPSQTKTVAQTKNDLNQADALISALGAQASVTQLVTQKQNELTLAQLAGVKISKDQVDSILEHTRADALGLTAIQASIDAQRVQAMTQDLGVGAGAAYAAVQDRINTAVRAGQPLNASEIAQLREKAKVLGDVAQATSLAKLASDQSFATSQLGRTDNEQQVASALRAQYGDQYTSHLNDAVAGQIRLNQALTDTKGLAQNALSGFVKDLVAGKSASEALRGSLQTVESKLIDMATNALISNLFKSLLGAAGGTGGGGIFSGLFGTHHTGGVVGSGDAGPGRVLPFSAFAGAPKFHTGGLVSGEIPVIAKSGEGIFTPAQMKALAPVGGGGSGSGGGNNVQVVVNNNASGTDVQTNSRKEGGVDIHEITISAVGDAMASGRFDGPMRARYSQQVKPRSR